MIKKNILFTFLFSTALYSQGNIEIISLQDAIDIALEKNHKHKAIRIES